ncbi:MAG: hypothetical protein K6G11_04065, partial [Lachnospiraceae bacterium]|nr:hypothetical protein [Lachnospiraceae bacterium]
MPKKGNNTNNNEKELNKGPIDPRKKKKKNVFIDVPSKEKNEIAEENINIDGDNLINNDAVLNTSIQIIPDDYSNEINVIINGNSNIII